MEATGNFYKPFALPRANSTITDGGERAPEPFLTLPWR